MRVLKEAEELLGRPVNIWGQVAAGSGRGRTLGFPTANLQTEQEILPPYGVYVVRVHLDDEIFEGVMNVGHRPTFEGENDLTFEVHLFDFEGNIYGEEINVDVLHKLRDERKFDSKEDLCAQIAQDCLQSRDYFKK